MKVDKRDYVNISVLENSISWNIDKDVWEISIQGFLFN